MELYLSLRALHICCVSLAGVGFLLRGIWMLRRSPLLEHRFTRTLPHVNDTLLLGAAIGMIGLAGLNPLDHAWLMAKLTGLLVYIVLGSIALRRGRTLRIRALAFFGALVSFGYIVSVALMRNPLPFIR
jgi:uncharacterized membrane protein SirB2